MLTYLTGAVVLAMNKYYIVLSCINALIVSACAFDTCQLIRTHPYARAMLCLLVFTCMYIVYLCIIFHHFVSFGYLMSNNMTKGLSITENVACDSYNTVT